MHLENLALYTVLLTIIKDDNLKLKVVIVGDGAVGKTSFLYRWDFDFFNVPNCFDNHGTKIYVVDGKEVSVSLWEQVPKLSWHA